MRFTVIKCHGSGNDFPLIDARGMALADTEWASVSRALADRAGPVGGDGLLLLVDGRGAAAFGQRMFNPDGSEAETCLNGLRCVARAGFEAIGLDEALVSLPKSDALAARVAPLADGVVTIRTQVTSVSTDPRDVGLMVDAPVIEASIPGLPSHRAFTAVAMPNPHLVTFVDTIDEAELVTLGDWCEAGPALIPGRANVSFVTQDAKGGLFVRTYERGAGLTDSCGSAMGASVHAAVLTGRVPAGKSVEVRNRGGLVRASGEAAGDGARVSIAGNATFLDIVDVTIDMAAARVTSVDVLTHRDAEQAAWLRALNGGIVASH
jgi:diaminopimelate epimerase